MESRSHSRSRARNASSRFRRMTSGHPPSTSDSMNRSAAGTESHAVGSNVPVQSNSRWKRLRSRRSAFAPWLMIAGRTA